MIGALRDLLTELADTLLGDRGREHHKALGRLRSRVELIATDLDCDNEGSIAHDLALLRDEHNNLRARIDEWIPTIAEAAKDEGTRP